MRTLLITLAIGLLSLTAAFWGWVERQKPVLPPGEQERGALVEELRVAKNREVAPEVQERARKLGADLEGGRQYLLSSYGIREENPNSARLWSAALSTPGRLYEEAKKRYETYLGWRLSLAFAGGSASLLLLALAASQPKTARPSGRGKPVASEGGDKPQTNV